MRLSDKQALFVEMEALLIQWASAHRDQTGHRIYRLREGRGYASPAANKADKGHPRSNHLRRLAKDYIFDKWNGVKWVYQTSTKAYEPLGLFWESIGGAWGGRFNDGNHFSLEHQGVK